MMTTRENWKKYEKTYFMPPTPCYDWVKKDCVDKAPIWCSVDLRDGNQALIEPMSLDAVSYTHLTLPTSDLV
mgnify:FL=1